jgi:hypothetical protein
MAPSSVARNPEQQRVETDELAISPETTESAGRAILDDITNVGILRA